jgi:hypothetical protein
MANEHIARLDPQSFINCGGTTFLGGPYSGRSSLAVGCGAGVSLEPGKTTSVYAGVRIPEAAALATGITADLAVGMPAGTISIPKAVVLGITIGPVTSGTSTFDEDGSTGPLAGSTEVTATITLVANPVIVVQAFAIVIAKLNSLAAGGHALVRIRRLGTNAADTFTGPVVLLWGDLRNT